MAHNSSSKLADWLGIRTDIMRYDTRWLGRILGFFTLTAAAALIVLVIILLFLMFRASISIDDGTDVRNIGLVLAAIIGAPFIIWRSAVAAKQAKIAEEGLETERITKAIEQIGSDQIAVRLGGIYAIERLIQSENGDEVRLMETLNAYLLYHQAEMRNSMSQSDIENQPPRIDIQAVVSVLSRNNPN